MRTIGSPESIDIPTTMREVTETLGGVVLDDAMDTASKKADYWFPDDNVVAELKCLSEDLSQKPDFKRRLTALHRSWVQRGLLPRPSSRTLRFDLRSLPAQCASEFLDPLKRRFEGTVRDANRQIRESKKTLGVPDAVGLLLLANDGNFMFPPTMLVHLLWRVLNKQHSSIDHVILFSANVNVKVPGASEQGPFWIEVVPEARRAMTTGFLDRLEVQWMASISRLLPGITEVQFQATQEALDEMQFIVEQKLP